MYEAFLERENTRRVSLSMHEMERRWQGLRERMAEQNIDYLVVQSQQRAVGGYFRYFTDMAGANYHITAIFPRHEGMTILTHGPAAPSAPVAPPPWENKGVRAAINMPAFPNVWWEDSWDADNAAKVMKKTDPKKIGLVGLGNMSAALYENLKKNLPHVEFVNATELVDELRIVKSEEELKLLHAAARMHEIDWNLAKEIIKTGATVSEVFETIRHGQVLQGSEEQQIGIWLGKPGGTVYHQMNWGNTCIRPPFTKGTVIKLLIESSAAGGYWYDLVRYLCIGEMQEGLPEAMEIAKEARDIMAKNLKPGMTAGEAIDASNAFLISKGCPAETRLAGHGQGLDLVERPVMLHEEPAKMQAGMIVCLHPTAKTKYASASLSDTYVIDESGAVPIYQSLFDDNEIVVTD